MKPTTTPNGATLMWLEAGDILQDNDVSEDNRRALVARSYPTLISPPPRMSTGRVLTTEDIMLFRPRRYIPLAE